MQAGEKLRSAFFMQKNARCLTDREPYFRQTLQQLSAMMNSRHGRK